MTLEKYVLSKELHVIICKRPLSYEFSSYQKQNDSAILFITLVLRYVYNFEKKFYLKPKGRSLFYNLIECQ